MQIGTVVGTVVSTQKHRKLEGAKLLLVQPHGPDGTPRGGPLLAIDSVGAGIGERVLVVIEGKAAGDALGRKAAPVDAAIVGIIDQIDLENGGGTSRRPKERRHHDRRSIARARARRRGASSRSPAGRRQRLLRARPA